MPFLVISFLLLFSSLSLALPVELITGGILQSGDQVEYQSKVSGGSHQIILSAPKRINNDLFIEKDTWVNGDIHRVLLRFSSSSTIDKYLESFTNLMRTNGKVEYQCQQRGCGVSSYWANNIYDERRLSARDSDQYYLAGTIINDGVSYWMSIYLVTNALRQNLAYISYIKQEKVNSVWKNGYQVPLSGIIPAEIITSLDQELSRNSDIVLYLAAYVDGAKVQSVNEMQQLVALPLKELETKLLEALQVESARIQTQFVGGAHLQTSFDNSDYWFRLFVFSP